MAKDGITVSEEWMRTYFAVMQRLDEIRDLISPYVKRGKSGEIHGVEVVKFALQFREEERTLHSKLQELVDEL